MNARIDLLWIGQSQSPVAWTAGDVHRAARRPQAVHDAIEQGLKDSKAEALLFVG